jgi:hypothetical protein
LDLDPAAEIYCGSDLIWAVLLGSGGWEDLGAWGRRRRRRSSAPRRMVAGATESGVPGLDSGRGLVQKDERGVRDTAGPKPGLGRCLSGAGFKRWRVGAAEHAGERHPGPGLGLGASIASAKERVGLRVLTEGVEWSKTWRRRAGGEVRRRRTVGAGEEARGPGDTGLLRAPGWHEPRPDGATKPSKGSERSEDPWRRGIAAAA